MKSLTKICFTAFVFLSLMILNYQPAYALQCDVPIVELPGQYGGVQNWCWDMNNQDTDPMTDPDSVDLTYIISYTDFSNIQGITINGSYELSYTVGTQTNANIIIATFSGGPIDFNVNGVSYEILFNDVNFTIDFSQFPYSYQTNGTISINGTTVSISGIDLFKYLF